ncbi:hypothetical protein LWC34_15045 [Kibdelosporangium philippinense]|uniref:Uncharacterized protein n=1 Tax=Kibdelosporangium philippinense TaxID=211113 RepID=A0ABS8Z8B7_9PSEU|nr:hypothetical protein [Kibdelosporangium philippinense]MCE7004140.1 hypothetical protein [Kibdelosporangium philippinense]
MTRRLLREVLTGDPANPAIPGVRPQVTSDISTSNGDSMQHAANVHGVLMLADEMSSCQVASQRDPNDEWLLQGIPSGFAFPDSEKLIQAEYATNLPFALSVAQSAPRPDEPVSVLGRTATPLTPRAFTTSYADGGAQTVAVTGRKNLGTKQLHYRIDQGSPRSVAVAAWAGGKVTAGITTSTTTSTGAGSMAPGRVLLSSSGFRAWPMARP